MSWITSFSWYGSNWQNQFVQIGKSKQWVDHRNEIKLSLGSLPLSPSYNGFIFKNGSTYPLLFIQLLSLIGEKNHPLTNKKLLMSAYLVKYDSFSTSTKPSQDNGIGLCTLEQPNCIVKQKKRICKTSLSYLLLQQNNKTFTMTTDNN